MANRPFPSDPEARGRVIAGRSGWVVLGATPGSFIVRSLRDERKFLVTGFPEALTCHCGWSGGGDCEHVWAVRVRFATSKSQAVLQIIAEHSDSDSVSRGYREGQEAEYVWFDPLASALLEAVPEPARVEGRPGRPQTPLCEALFVAVKKSHEGLSCSRLAGKYGDAAAKGLLSTAWNYSLPSRILGREDITPLLIQLVRESAKPLIDFEDGGTIAIDSSGFVTSAFGTYFGEAHGVERRHEFVKAHVAVGTRTHIVTNVIVTDHRGADSPQFESLLRGTVDSGFRPIIVTADKAYSSRRNLQVADELGIQPFIPFRDGVGPTPKGVRVWRDMWHLFQLNPDAFNDRYHQRSNVEATFSAIKRRLGESLFSKRPVARQNELLCKILAYNIVTVIRHLVARGINPAPLFRDRGGVVPGGQNSLPSSSIGCESIGSAVKEPLPAEE